MKDKNLANELKQIKSTLSDGEKITIKTLEELSDNKGDED